MPPAFPDASIRWQACERMQLSPTVTAIIDHTNIELPWLASNPDAYAYLSGHKGMSVKFLVAVTPQGSPIGVSSAQPARHHDFYYMQPVFAQGTRPRTSSLPTAGTAAQRRTTSSY